MNVDQNCEAEHQRGLGIVGVPAHPCKGCGDLTTTSDDRCSMCAKVWTAYTKWVETTGEFLTTLAQSTYPLNNDAPGEAVEWVIQDQASVRIAATPNGVPEASLKRTVEQVRLGFASTDPKAGQQIKWPAGVGPVAQKAIRDIVGKLKQDLEAITLTAGDHAPLTLRRTSRAGLAKQFRGYTDYGEVDGILDVVSVRGGISFGITEHGTGHKIRCAFPDSMFEIVKNAMRQRVVVEGLINYRHDASPVSMRDITHLVVLSRENRSIHELAGSLPKLTKGVEAGEYVRRLREVDDGH